MEHENGLHQTVNTAIDAYDILTRHTPRLLGIVSDPQKLSNELCAKMLLSEATKDKITTPAIGRHKKIRMIMDEVSLDFQQTEDKDRFIRFCNVLKEHGQPGLTELAEEMLSSI